MVVLPQSLVLHLNQMIEFVLGQVLYSFSRINNMKLMPPCQMKKMIQFPLTLQPKRLKTLKTKLKRKNKLPLRNKWKNLMPRNQLNWKQRWMLKRKLMTMKLKEENKNLKLHSNKELIPQSWRNKSKEVRKRMPDLKRIR